MKYCIFLCNPSNEEFPLLVAQANAQVDICMGIHSTCKFWQLICMMHDGYAMLLSRMLKAQGRSFTV